MDVILLNELQENMDENNQYILCPSDMILQSLNEDYAISRGSRREEVFSKSYKVNIGGVVKISLYGYCTGGRYDSTSGKFKIYKNGSVIKSSELGANSTITNYTTLDIITQINPNDIIKVSVTLESEYGDIGIDTGRANIYATPIPIRFKDFITLDE